MKSQKEPLVPFRKDVNEVRKYVGKPIPRYDSLGHVTGKTVFVNDISLPGMLTVKVRRSNVARGIIKNIDTSKAKEVKGVYAVLTGADVPHNIYGFYPDQPVLADKEVRFFGQPIVGVAAIDEDTAMEALQLVKIDIEELEPVLDPIEAMKEGSPLVRPEGNLWEFDEGVHYRRVRVGDIEAGLREADFVIKGEYSTPVQEHAMLEPNCAIGDIDESGRINVYTMSQGIFFHHGMLASVLQLPMNKINMIGGTVGGGFGGRNDLHSDHLAALMALKTQKPCKWLWTREEEMICSQHRGAWSFSLEYGVKADGRITAAKIKTIHDTGAYAGFGPYAVDKSCFTITGPYNIPNVYIDGYCVFTNKQVATSMRGFGINVGQFATEVHLDKVAREINMSPWDLRFINAWKEGAISATRQKMHAVGIIETLQATAKLAGEELSDEYLSMSSK
jgi:CO/xanthine dehydrogenase Mo-binding subunit